MDIVTFIQNLMSQVPFFIQPLIVAVAAMVPFVEGELASVLGVWAGLNPVVAAVAAAAGNFASVFVVVFFGSRIRAAIVTRRARRRAVGQPASAAAARQLVPAGQLGATGEQEMAEQPSVEPKKPESKGVRRFKRFLVRFGVPGASILGPLAIPTQFTSAILVSTGVAKGWVLLWQAVAISLWTTFTTLVATGVLALVEG